MSVTRVVCPHCSHHLRTDKPVATGQRAHCPRYGQAFRIGGAPPIAPAPHPPFDKGLKALSEYIGHPMLWGRPNPRNGQDCINLYAMWSIERVGALYHLRRINGKAWYPWGVDQLLEWQESDGAWRVGQMMSGGYGGTEATDTCFALLFLRRADFARDLSKKLEFFTEGKELLSNR